MGCGKSRIGRALANKLGLRFIDLDEAVVKRSGHSIDELFADGEAHFRQVELETLRAVLSRFSGDTFVLSLGGGTVTTPEALDLILSQTTSFYLKCPYDVLKARLENSSVKRPLFNERAAALFASRESLYEKAAFTVVTEGKTPQMIVDEIVSVLER